MLGNKAAERGTPTRSENFCFLRKRGIDFDSYVRSFLHVRNSSTVTVLDGKCASKRLVYGRPHQPVQKLGKTTRFRLWLQGAPTIVAIAGMAASYGPMATALFEFLYNFSP